MFLKNIFLKEISFFGKQNFASQVFVKNIFKKHTFSQKIKWIVGPLIPSFGDAIFSLNTCHY